MTVFDTAVQVVLNLEGGLSLDERDAGNWTGGRQGAGELRGTKFGISAASYPDLNIRDLTREDAIAIYRKDFWLRAGCDMLPGPLAVVAFDAAVNSGVGTAQRLLRESSNTLDFIGKRFEHYASLEQFDIYGRGWTKRFSTIVQHAAKLEPEPGKRPDQTPDRLILTHTPDGETTHQQTIPDGADILIRIKGGADRIHVRADIP